MFDIKIIELTPHTQNYLPSIMRQVATLRRKLIFSATTLFPVNNTQSRKVTIDSIPLIL
jgi:hypothetical protein